MEAQEVSTSVLVRGNKWPFTATVMTPSGSVTVIVSENRDVQVIRGGIAHVLPAGTSV